MPRSKSTKYYPSEFFDLADRVGKMLVPQVTLQFPTEKEAKSLQGRYYAFLGALKREAEAGPLNRGDSERQEWEFKSQLLPFAHKVYITTNGRGEITFKHRSETWYAKAMREELAKALMPESGAGLVAAHTIPADDSPEIKASLEKLFGKREGPRADYATLSEEIRAGKSGAAEPELPNQGNQERNTKL